jgi:hypothetical protein
MNGISDMISASWLLAGDGRVVIVAVHQGIMLRMLLKMILWRREASLA